MKKFKQFILPAVVVLMGAGAAFATNAAKASDSDLVTGYYIDSSTSQCTAVENVQCTTTPGDLCTWTDPNKDTHVLSRFINNTTCGQELYKP